MGRRDTTPAARFAAAVRLLVSYRGEIGRREFVLAEGARGVGLLACYGLYRTGWIVVAATLVPVAVWPGVVATIKRFRDLGHDPVVILPVLVYLSGSFAVGYRYGHPVVGWLALGVCLLYVGGVEGRPDAFES